MKRNVLIEDKGAVGIRSKMFMASYGDSLQYICIPVAHACPCVHLTEENEDNGEMSSDTIMIYDFD